MDWFTLHWDKDVRTVYAMYQYFNIQKFKIKTKGLGATLLN